MIPNNQRASSLMVGHWFQTTSNDPLWSQWPSRNSLKSLFCKAGWTSMQASWQLGKVNWEKTEPWRNLDSNSQLEFQLFDFCHIFMCFPTSMGSNSREIKKTISGGWFQPLWKIWKSVGMIIPNIYIYNYVYIYIYIYVYIYILEK